MLRQLYLSPLGRVISLLMNAAASAHRPFIAYGYRDRVSGKFRKRTRISSSATLISRERVAMGEGVWIGHYCHIDGSAGVRIGDGVQFATWSGVLSHGSQDAIRLCGPRYIEIEARIRPGYTFGQVEIGDYAFIGAGAIILPGVRLGRGCRIDAGTIVTKDVPDFAIARGVPAAIVGDVRDIDVRYFDSAIVQQSYFDRETIAQFQEGGLPHGSVQRDPPGS
jgi:acetyltransferase-like isoleucine patch superfamily enzyme